ncbi:MAG: LptF/LptG family permease [Gemmatimonadota bacterium]
MKIIHKYIMAEIYAPYLIGLFTFTLVVLLQRFSRLADLIVAKGIPPQLVGRLLLSMFPSFLEITLPAALLLAVLLAMGRLGADSETTALCTAGVGMRGVVPPVLAMSVLTFLASLFIAWEGISWGQREMNATLSRILEVRAGAGASEHVFTEIAPDVLLFPDRVSADGTSMTGVLLSQRIPGREPVLVLAKDGEFAARKDGSGVGLALHDGTIHHEDEASGIYRMASFRTMEFRLPREAVASARRDEPRSLSLPQLFRKIAEAGGRGEAAAYRYHFHRRLSLAASCLAFGLLAIPLGLSQRARGRSPAFALTVAIILAYYMFIAAAGSVESSAPGLMALLLWLPNAIGLCLAGWILWRSESRMISMPSLFGRFGSR